MLSLIYNIICTQQLDWEASPRYLNGMWTSFRSTSTRAADNDVTTRLIAAGHWKTLDDAAHEGGGAERGVRLPRDVLGAVQVVTDAAYEHKAVLAVATYRLDDLIKLGIHGDALVTQREVLTQHVVLDNGLAGTDGAVTQDGLALAVPRLHLSKRHLRVSKLNW